MVQEPSVRDRLELLLPRLHRFALALTANPEDAADLTQSTCERILSREDQWAPGTEFHAWAFRIMRTRWMNEMRRQRIRERENFASRDIDAVIADIPSLDNQLVHREIIQTVMQLPATHREVVLLCLVEGQTYHEAAAILDVADGTVMSRLARARSTLKQKLNRKAIHPDTDVSEQQRSRK